jgi:hypothetical protein
MHLTAYTHPASCSVRWRTGHDINDGRTQRELVAQQLVDVGVLVFEEEQSDGAHSVEGKAKVSNDSSLVRVGACCLAIL